MVVSGNYLGFRFTAKECALKPNRNIKSRYLRVYVPNTDGILP